MTRADWLDEAACRGMDTAMFFPQPRDSGHQAKAVCESCPVRSECLADALALGDEHGIRAGLNARRRNKLLDRRPIIANHGTDAGYARHRRMGEAACDACREAHAASWHRRKIAENAARTARRQDAQRATA